jgi:hypothetical protein
LHFNKQNEVAEMSKKWEFRSLLIVLIVLFLVSWFMPWWSINVYEIGKDAAVIHPWGLETNLRASEANLIASANMPVWFGPMMFAYLVIAMGALVFSLFAKRKEFKVGNFKVIIPNMLIALVGFSYVVVVVTAVVYAAIRTSEFFGGVNLIGYTYIDFGEPYYSGADAGLLIGYWLACAVGPALIALGLLRNKIIGQPKKVVKARPSAAKLSGASPK